MSKIMELRKSGKLQEAYKIGLEALEKEPTNPKVKIEFAWVLNDILKSKIDEDQNHLPKSEKDNYLHLIDKFITLEISESEKTLINSISWQIIKLINNISNSSNPDIYLINHIVSRLKKIPYDKPSPQHSLLLHAILKLDIKPIYFIHFISWWGIDDNFRPEDLEPYKISGKEKNYTINSLAERTACEILKHILEFIKDSQVNTAENKQIHLIVKILYNKVEKLIAQHPKFLQLRYQFVKFHLNISKLKNRFDITPLPKTKLLQIILPFARLKKDEFWLWDTLSELVPDNKMRISCLCRAMMSKVDEKFLINVKEKLAEYFINERLYKEAKIEISQIIQIRKQNNWPIPKKISNITSESWYKSTKTNINENNKKFYAENGKNAEEILLLDLKSYIAVIKGLNEDKGIAYFVSGEKNVNKELLFEGSFNYKKYNLKITVGDFVELKALPEDNTTPQHLKVFFAKKTNQKPPEFVYKEIEDFITIKTDRKGNTIGFSADVFIPPDLMQGTEKYTTFKKYKIYAVMNYNESKKTWNWIALKIK